MAVDSGILQRTVQGITDSDLSSSYVSALAQLLVSSEWKKFPNILMDCVRKVTSYKNDYLSNQGKK